MSSQMPCVMPLFPLAALQFSDRVGWFLPWPGLWSEWIRQLHHFCHFWERKKIPRKHKPRIRCCFSVYFTRPSTTLVKALEAASFWHWAWWRVLGGAWLKYIILFQLSLFLGGIQSCKSSRLHCHFAQGPFSRVYINTWLRPTIFALRSKSQHLDLLWLAD